MTTKNCRYFHINFMSSISGPRVDLQLITLVGGGRYFVKLVLLLFFTKKLFIIIIIRS
jgi:hypothetical protein